MGRGRKLARSWILVLPTTQRFPLADKLFADGYIYKNLRNSQIIPLECFPLLYSELNHDQPTSFTQVPSHRQVTHVGGDSNAPPPLPPKPGPKPLPRAPLTGGTQFPHQGPPRGNPFNFPSSGGIPSNQPLSSQHYFNTQSGVSGEIIQLYSGTSVNGHSEEWKTSLQWTNCLPLISIHFYLIRRDNF